MANAFDKKAKPAASTKATKDAKPILNINDTDVFEAATTLARVKEQIAELESTEARLEAIVKPVAIAAHSAEYEKKQVNPGSTRLEFRPAISLPQAQQKVDEAREAVEKLEKAKKKDADKIQEAKEALEEAQRILKLVSSANVTSTLLIPNDKYKNFTNQEVAKRLQEEYALFNAKVVDGKTVFEREDVIVKERTVSFDKELFAKYEDKLADILTTAIENSDLPEDAKENLLVVNDVLKVKKGVVDRLHVIAANARRENEKGQMVKAPRSVEEVANDLQVVYVPRSWKVEVPVAVNAEDLKGATVQAAR
jgi:hypothetical protein